MSKIIQLHLGLSNAYLIKSERSILVDAGSPGEADKILALAAKQGVQSSDIALILLTHGHIDHAGSAANLQQRLGIPVAVHAADVDMLTAGENRPFQTVGLEAKLVNLFLSSSFPPVTPDLLLDEAFDLAAYGVDGHIVHTPGHTAGSVSLMLASGDAIAGDVLRGGYMGGRLQPTKPLYHYFAEQPEQTASTLRTLMSHKPHTLYVGHGGPLSMARVERKFRALFT